MKKANVWIFCFILTFLLIPLRSAAAASELFPAYIYEGIMRYDTAGIAAGTRVRLYEAESNKHYVVGRRQGGARVRVPWDAVEPIAKSTPTLPQISAADITEYAGSHLFSKTDFLLWVDLSRARLYVLEYADEGWQLLRTLPCALGDPAHPTPSGTFEVRYKCAAIGKEDLYLCRHALCFYGGYMLHSVLFSWGGEDIIDGRMGMRISHGCVRLRYEDSRQLYEEIPIGTTVFIR